MAVTIEQRIRWTVLGAILATFAVTSASVLIANENLVWDTATLKVYHRPTEAVADDRLPTIFRNLPVPFSGEVEIGTGSRRSAAISA